MTAKSFITLGPELNLLVQGGLMSQLPQWVETNPSNICICPTDIVSLPNGTTLTALIRMLNTDVCGC
jgi:hypothetical protein